MMSNNPNSNSFAVVMASFLITCCLFTGGCASTAVIAAAGVTAGFGLAQGQAEAFIRGELQAARMVPMAEAVRAAIAALEELQVEIKTRRIGAHDAYLRARAEGGREIQVKFLADSPVVTKFKVRVGIMGDQAVSRLVLARIDAQLGIVHPAIPVEESPFVAPVPPPPSLPPPPNP